jgi:endoglucanase
VYDQPWFTARNFPDDLFDVWYDAWAYLRFEGIGPVLVGEFGGRSVSADQEGIWQRTLVGYLKQYGFSYTYWAWNPDSADTGGVLQDDWCSIDQYKLEVLSYYQWPLLHEPDRANESGATERRGRTRLL